MKPELIFPSDFEPKYSDKFFLDTNVWLYLIFPHHSNIGRQITAEYSSFYSKVLRKECLIESTIVQISEIVNLILHLEFRSFKKAHTFQGDFKEYRKSEYSKEALKNAQILINSIKKSATIRSGNLTPEEILNLASKIELADFNDLCYAEHCFKEKAILVTHDFDFNALNKSLKIISANKRFH